MHLRARTIKSRTRMAGWRMAGWRMAGWLARLLRGKVALIKQPSKIK